MTRDRYRALCRDISSIGKNVARLERELRMLTLDTAKLKAAVDRANAGIDSALAILNTQSAQIKDLADKLAAAIAANDPTAIQAIQTELDQYADTLNSEADKIAAATQAPPTG